MREHRKYRGNSSDYPSTPRRSSSNRYQNSEREDRRGPKDHSRGRRRQFPDKDYGGDKDRRYNRRSSFRRRNFDGGNQRERITVESGYLVLIDQFMLANPQFIENLKIVLDDVPDKKDDLIRRFGGQVLKLDPGVYKVERDPIEMKIIIRPGENQDEDDDFSAEISSNLFQSVFIDTRCLAMIDRELLDDIGLIDRYQNLWFGGQSKACRDLLRDNGGAVRYGFSRDSDELSIQGSTSSNSYKLSINHQNDSR
jgi:hypothetical protein